MRPPRRALAALWLATVATASHASLSQSPDAENYEEADPEAVDMQSVLAALGLLSGTFLAVLLGLRLYLHCMRRRPQREHRRKKLTQTEIEAKFPVTKSAGGETCVVCLSSIEADEDCRVTQCGHVFHADCLLAWWLHKPRRVLRCPICRTRQRTSERRRKSEEAVDGNASAAENRSPDHDAADGVGTGDDAVVGPVERLSNEAQEEAAECNADESPCEVKSSENVDLGANADQADEVVNAQVLSVSV